MISTAGDYRKFYPAVNITICGKHCERCGKPFGYCEILRGKFPECPCGKTCEDHEQFNSLATDFLKMKGSKFPNG